ncbi:MAG: hypothetical protein NTV44_00405, partial [Firmicutes bacterium]|nr:hypothetical protein [Bacillota bacterium]
MEKDEDDIITKKKKSKLVELSGEYILCKNCGAIVPVEEAHNQWCTCENTNEVRLIKLDKDLCSICGGTLRRFNLGYEAATGVVATALYEQIPEFAYREENVEKRERPNPFLTKSKTEKSKEKTGSQFLVFSDSRQGAAKFACFLGDSYKEFLRRRGIWNVIDAEEKNFDKNIGFDDFRKLLENFYSSHKLFRESNDPNTVSSVFENRRNSWIALLNELYNSSRRTSLVSLGKMSFEYLGNSSIVQIVAEQNKVSKTDSKNLLDFLFFEIVRTGAIITENETDINDVDRKYLYFSSVQPTITKNIDPALKFAKPWMPSSRQLKDGSTFYYRNKKFEKVKQVLHLDDKQALEFLENY